jgi:hypothetical protein
MKQTSQKESVTVAAGKALSKTAKVIKAVFVEPEAAPGRRSKPAYPQGLTALSSIVACEQILKASNWELHHAITGVERVRTIHLAPAVAAYKAEMLEYLRSRQGAK